MSTRMKTIVGVAIALVIVGAGVWGAMKFGTKSTIRSLDPNKPNGTIIGVDPIDEMKTQAESYDLGRQDGLEGRGIHTLTRDELRELADEGIRRYSRYVGDPDYQREAEEYLEQKPDGQDQAPAPKADKSSVKKKTGKSAAPKKAVQNQPVAQPAPTGANAK